MIEQGDLGHEKNACEKIYICLGMDILESNRKSDVEHGGLYLWTATINGGKHLMAEDSMKMEVIQLLQWRTHKNFLFRTWLLFLRRVSRPMPSNYLFQSQASLKTPSVSILLY